MDDTSLPVTTEALMFIITTLNSVWKLPIAYFLIDGMTANIKCNLVSEAIQRLYQVNVRVTAVVCDGSLTNFAVGSRLAASLSVQDMRPYFYLLWYRPPNSLLDLSTSHQSYSRLDRQLKYMPPNNHLDLSLLLALFQFRIVIDQVQVGLECVKSIHLMKSPAQNA